MFLAKQIKKQADKYAEEYIAQDCFSRGPESRGFGWRDVAITKSGKCDQAEINIIVPIKLLALGREETFLGINYCKTRNQQKCRKKKTIKAVEKRLSIPESEESRTEKEKGPNPEKQDRNRLS